MGWLPRESFGSGCRDLREQQSRAELGVTDVKLREEHRQLLPGVQFIGGGLAPRPGQSPPYLGVWEFPFCPGSSRPVYLGKIPERGISTARPRQAGWASGLGKTNSFWLTASTCAQGRTHSKDGGRAGLKHEGPFLDSRELCQPWRFRNDPREGRGYSWKLTTFLGETLKRMLLI